jgi:hypothetical protein
MRSMEMPFGIRQQIERIRTYSTEVEAEAHDDCSKALVSLLNASANDLEVISRIMFSALDRAPNPWLKSPGPPTRGT